VLQFLNALEAAGCIERREGARNVRIIRPPQSEAALDRTETTPVPVVGQVAAGLPILAEENVEEYVAVSTRLARPPHRYFLLRVRGDSMNRAGILEGDLVLVRHQRVANAGDSVVALIDDSATIKRLRPGASTIVLEPDSTNTAHGPIIVDADFQIQGVVVGTVSTGEHPKGKARR
jgi:repressor LexA